MGRASPVLFKNFGLNFVNKLFVVFCLAQLECTESKGETKEEKGVEPQNVQEESLPTPPIDSDPNCEESKDITFLSPLELMATPDKEEIQEEPAMVCVQEGDLDIGSLYCHSVNEPISAISISQEQEAVYVNPEVLAILPTVLGASEESPIEFLREFDKTCRVQKRPEGSSEEDLKLRVISLSLKSEADAWFRGLEPNSIKTWLDFIMEFLNHIILVAKTNALRREIREITQEYGESLSKYWHRYKGLLDACPNHNLMEVEIYSKFYDRMDAKSKDLVNSSSGGSFYKLRLSKAKIVLEKLLNAKREYNDSSMTPVQEKVKSTPTEDKDNLLRSRIDKLEETLRSVIDSRYHPVIPIQTNFQTDQVSLHQNTWEFWR